LRLDALGSVPRRTQYAAVLAGVIAATLLRLPFESLLDGQTPYALFYLPILVSAWLFGVGPTLLAVGLSGLAAWLFFMPPMTSLARGGGASVVLFFIVSGAMVMLARSAAAARRATADELRAASLDLAERKRAEGALAEQREQFRVTLASIGDAVVTTNRDGKVAFMNSVAEALTGWSLTAAVGQALDRVFDAINEDSRQPIVNPVDQVLRTGAVVDLATHTLLRARDGRLRPVTVSAAPIIDDNRNVQGVVLVFRDVSEQRRGELEQRAAERDREQLLSSERAARADAERATRLKDDFVATLSHELRTPLNAILGWTQVLRRGRSEDREALARGLEVIERNTRLQAQLISDLLDVSRIVSGKLRLELALVDLGAVIDSAMETVREAAEIKRVRIRRVIDEAVPPLVGDHARLQQIVWNLLSNAIKFTPENGTVSVALSRQDVAAVVTVSDDGIGINPEFVPYLFDRFRQADSSAARRFGGLGLGLAIVKQLAELHNGVVSAESPGEGKGATFVVRLPLGVAREEVLADRAGSASLAATVAGQARLDGILVLVVEDDSDTRELVERLLSENGARVKAVETAASALAQFRSDPPDLLVSDIGLPGQDGYSLIEQIRGLPSQAGAGVPAIALTAFARSEDRTRALRAGFQAHVAKPVEPAELVATVASFAQMVRTRTPESPRLGEAAPPRSPDENTGQGTS
jgi:PAS domain S-box-containing protein